MPLPAVPTGHPVRAEGPIEYPPPSITHSQHSRHSRLAARAFRLADPTPRAYIQTAGVVGAGGGTPLLPSGNYPTAEGRGRSGMSGTPLPRGRGGFGPPPRSRSPPISFPYKPLHPTLPEGVQSTPGTPAFSTPSSQSSPWFLIDRSLFGCKRLDPRQERPFLGGGWVRGFPSADPASE